VLYLFLWQAVAVIWKDLHRAAAGDAEYARPAAKLVVIDGGSTSYRPGHSFPIYGTATIGRGSDNSIVLQDQFVSAAHAQLTYREGSWWLADLGSRNGTFVNGERVNGEVRLGDGDVLAMGQLKMKLRTDG